MTGHAFFDTNVLIYALAQEDRRCGPAEELLALGGVISVQVLNEFASVARRKLLMPWPDVTEAIAAVLELCPKPVPITLELHQSALRIAERYLYGIYDALVVVAALHAQCEVLYSEDFRDGQTIDGQLEIRNPFGGSGSTKG